MANQVGNTGVSRFDSNQLRPNGALPTRNGIKGQSLGRLSRTGALQQDTVELTKKAAHKLSAHAKVASTTADPMEQIKHLLDSVNADSATAAKAHNTTPSAVYSVSTAEVTSTAEVSGVEDAAHVSRKDEFVSFVTNVVNTVRDGDTEQVLNMFMDMFSSRTGMEFVEGQWTDPGGVYDGRTMNMAFESFMSGTITEIAFAEPDRLTNLLASWFDSGLTNHDSTPLDWDTIHNWTPAGDFANYTREELVSAISDVMTGAGFSLNHITETEDGATVNGGGPQNNNGNFIGIMNSTTNMFRQMTGDYVPQAPPVSSPGTSNDNQIRTERNERFLNANGIRTDTAENRVEDIANFRESATDAEFADMLLRLVRYMNTGDERFLTPASQEEPEPPVVEYTPQAPPVSPPSTSNNNQIRDERMEIFYNANGIRTDTAENRLEDITNFRENATDAEFADFIFRRSRFVNSGDESLLTPTPPRPPSPPSPFGIENPHMQQLFDYMGFRTDTRENLNADREAFLANATEEELNDFNARFARAIFDHMRDSNTSNPPAPEQPPATEATSQVSEVASVEEAVPTSRKAEFLEFATSFINSVKGGDAEQVLNKFMDMFASRTEMEFVNGEWSPTSGIPNDVPDWTSENREFELLLTQLIGDVDFADPDVLAGTLLNWFDAGAATTEGSWHQWSPSGDFAGYTREELSSAIADVLTNAGFTLNHIDHASGMVNSGAGANENLVGGSRVALGDSVVSLFRERAANAASQATPTPPPSGTTSSSNVSSTSQASGQMTASDVLDKLRGMMPGWVINGDWQSGFRNIQIDQSVLERMASDPAEFDRVMEIIRGFEELVPELEKWAEQNPGKSLLLSFNTDEDGATSLIARMIDSLGNERTANAGAGDIASWRENLQQILESFSRETNVQDEEAEEAEKADEPAAQTTAAARRNRPANPAAIRNLWRDTNQRGEAVLTLIRASIGNSNGTGQASLGAMANGGMNVSEADRLRAQEMVSENGFFGVQQTTDRIMSFAKALVGENASAEDIEKMREAVQRGFDEVAHLFGGFNNLPGVTQDTHAAIMQAFDDWAAGASS